MEHLAERWIEKEIWRSGAGDSDMDFEIDLRRSSHDCAHDRQLHVRVVECPAGSLDLMYLARGSLSQK
jgi:hypothetical protein